MHLFHPLAATARLAIAIHYLLLERMDCTAIAAANYWHYQMGCMHLLVATMLKLLLLNCLSWQDHFQTLMELGLSQTGNYQMTNAAVAVAVAGNSIEAVGMIHRKLVVRFIGTHHRIKRLGVTARSFRITVAAVGAVLEVSFRMDWIATAVESIEAVRNYQITAVSSTMAELMAYHSWAQTAFAQRRAERRRRAVVKASQSPSGCCPGLSTCRWQSGGSPSTSGTGSGCWLFAGSGLQRWLERSCYC